MLCCLYCQTPVYSLPFALPHLRGSATINFNISVTTTDVTCSAGEHQWYWQPLADATKTEPRGHDRRTTVEYNLAGS